MRPESAKASVQTSLKHWRHAYVATLFLQLHAVSATFRFNMRQIGTLVAWRDLPALFAQGRRNETVLGNALRATQAAHGIERLNDLGGANGNRSLDTMSTQTKRRRHDGRTGTSFSSSSFGMLATALPFPFPLLLSGVESVALRSAFLARVVGMLNCVTTVSIRRSRNDLLS